jgi:hypothetical protein
MKIFIRLVFFIVLIVIPTGYSFKRIDYRKGIRNNVCKVLQNDVLLYFIFVDSKETSPWTEFDIKSTIDSISVAVKWLELHARQNGVYLNIMQDVYAKSLSKIKVCKFTQYLIGWKQRLEHDYQLLLTDRIVNF